ncbi:alpha/beta hydrolase fold domain-containing protein [Yunchengibacter salinarum]|uniref:alpha/beta hydrolase fold domain-containing protein n=1 Tax=Yunchengibacter salinarum TaxID=3133399 RepID=UPI0035B66D7A
MRAILECLLMKAAMALPMTPRTAILRDGKTLDPGFARLIALREKMGLKDVDKMADKVGVEGVRRVYSEALRAMSISLVPLGVERLKLTVPGGEGPRPARLYTPSHGRHGDGMLLFFHGGGFTIGDLDGFEPFTRRVAYLTRMPVLSVDYRLAPEHPFPAASQDALAAAQAVVDDPGAFAPGCRRVALGGDSAGASLALGAAHGLLQTGRAAHALWLFNPAAAPGTDWPSMTTFGDGYILTKGMIDWFQRQYLGKDGRHGEKAGSGPGAPPLDLTRLERLADLPPCFLGVGGFDPLLDQNRALATALRDAGVKLTYTEENGLIHDYVTFYQASRTALQALERAAAWLRAQLA